MNGIAIGLGLLGLVATIVFLAWPWWGQPSKDNQGETVDDRYEAVLTALRDLDFDRTMGKLAAEDYTPLRQALLTEAVGIMTQWDEQAQAGSETRALAGERCDCPACDRTVRPGDLFCVGCGVDLSATQPECRRCGRMAGLGDQFCRDCGAQLVLAPGEPRLRAALEVRS